MEGFQTATVTRQDNRLTLQWEGPELGQVQIYWSENPDFQQAEGALLGHTAANSFTIEEKLAGRPYFLLVAENGARIRVAERVISMEGLVNFRDLGGYLTADGRRTKWGKLLRSAAHDTITDKDMAFLQEIGLKTVVDYRSNFEEADHPDKEIAGVQYLHLRPFQTPNATNILDTGQYQMKTAEDAVAMLTDTNRLLANNENCNGVYRQLVLLVLDEAQVPLVQHCTAGKDRVGVGSATLLLALGVPRETILADYLLSNENSLSASKLGTGITSKGTQISPEQLKLFEVFAKVRAEYLQAFFDEIDRLWGGTEGYLKQALGLTDEQLTKLQDMYLETM